jgi:riboflavin biosynthesis pyrimidine reductase
VVANFVQTIDGVVAIPELPEGNTLIADGSEADRVVMGLLRACADVVLIASGTMLASPAGTWRPERVYPPAAAGFAELRRRLQLPERPTLACVTSGRTFDPTHPALQGSAIVLTTEAAAAGLRARVPRATEIIATNSGDSVDLELGLQALRERGHSLIVTEGGPTLFGTLISAGLVDELFLTISPLLAGRARTRRLSLVEGIELLPDLVHRSRILSVRLQTDHLFLRYALR